MKSGKKIWHYIDSMVVGILSYGSVVSPQMGNRQSNGPYFQKFLQNGKSQYTENLNRNGELYSTANLLMGEPPITPSASGSTSLANWLRSCFPVLDVVGLILRYSWVTSD